MKEGTGVLVTATKPLTTLTDAGGGGFLNGLFGGLGTLLMVGLGLAGVKARRWRHTVTTKAITRAALPSLESAAAADPEPVTSRTTEIKVSAPAPASA